MGLSHKNTLSRVSVLQPKALHFRYFILKVTCFCQVFGQTLMKTILVQYQFHHIFNQDLVKKMVLMIFQLTFVQDSQMLLIPQVQTIVTWFLDTTWCIWFMEIIETCANTGKGLLHQTLQLVVLIYAARMIRYFNFIDRHHMVKILCASQECFQWYIFLTFTCNIRKHFVTKSILQ